MADILYDSRSKDNNQLIVVIAHGDADGLVSTMIIKHLEEIQSKELKSQKIKKEFFLLSSMDASQEQTEQILDFVCKNNSFFNNDKIYILDRSLPSLEWLSLGYLENAEIICIDHHITNHPDNYKNHYAGERIKFFWDDKESAAYLALKWFKEDCKNDVNLKKLYDSFEILAKSTSLWDTFSWKNLGNTPEDLIWKERALSINSAEKLLGGLGFYNLINRNIGTPEYSDELFKYFKILNDAYEVQIDNAYNFTVRTMTEHYYKNYKMGIVYGTDSKYQSIIADRIFMENKFNYSIIAFVNIFGTVSFRSKGEADVSLLAKNIGEISGFSGGGHKNASACKIYSKELTKKIMLDAFERSLNKVSFI